MFWTAGLELLHTGKTNGTKEEKQASEVISNTRAKRSLKSTVTLSPDRKGKYHRGRKGVENMRKEPPGPGSKKRGKK